MYDLTYKSDSGRSLTLNYQNGIIVSRVTGVTGMVVDTKTAQGYQQVGVSISSLTVGGRELTISGFIFQENAEKKQDMLNILSPFEQGRLYWDTRYWIDVVVKNAPEIEQEKDSHFSFRLFAPDPYFRANEEFISRNGETTGAFSFPVNYSQAHKFGTKTSDTQFVVTNSGQANAPFELTLEGLDDIVNPIVRNMSTGEMLKWNGTIAAGERLRVYNERGRIRVTLRNVSGVENNAIYGLDDDSTLFSLAVGDNIIQIAADSGQAAAEAIMSFYPLYSGVLMNGV